MIEHYFRQRIKFILSNYRLRWVRILKWPFTGARNLVFLNSANQRELVHKVAGWWLALFFLVFDLLLIGDGYELLTNLIKKARPLTVEEQETAQQIFGDSLRYQLIRLDEKASLVSKARGIAYVGLFTVNSWGAIGKRTLIHELTHVWQYQQLGLAYIPLALLAQRSKDGYDYGGPPALRKARSHGLGLASFNLEQQAEIIADYYSEKIHAVALRQPGSNESVSELAYFASQLHKGQGNKEYPGREVS